MSDKKYGHYAGGPVDLAPWAYLWRADRDIQDRPEADFIPHRLKRLDTIYRTHLEVLGPDQAKTLCYSNQPDMLEKFLPKPENPLLTGLLWVGGITDYSVELEWEDAVPAEADIEVRTYPTVWGWFGWTVDRLMTKRGETDGGKIWTYDPPEGLMIDHSYNSRVRAQTEMVAVFAPKGTPIPRLHVTGDSLGTWKELEFAVEPTGDADLKGWGGDYAAHVACVEDMKAENGRAVFRCLYSDVSRHGVDSRITFITDAEKRLGATVLLREIAAGPVYVPEAGLYFRRTDEPADAGKYISGISAIAGNDIRKRVAAHPESGSWEETIRNVRLWRCPDGTEITPFPESPEPEVRINIPDKRWQSMYELAVEQLRGPNMWGFLGAEVFRVAAAMEMAGLHAEADRIYDYFLASPGVKPDGDFPDGDGALEWAKTMRHDMAYAHEGCHTSTGGLLYAMMHRYFMTGDREWFAERLPRLKKAADWIIRMLRTYMKDECPEWDKLHVAGLMPPCFYGDYALPASDWHWYYHDNAAHHLGLKFFAIALSETGDSDAQYYTAEADRYESDIKAAVARESLFAPVRRGDDGVWRSFIPRMAYGGGLLQFGEETNIPQFAGGISDLFHGALPLALVGGAIDANDRRMAGTVDAMEYGGLKLNLARLEKLAHPTATEDDRIEAERLAAESAASKRTNMPPDIGDVWFWNAFSNLPKLAYNANVYLREDDVPSFLRFFLNHAAVMVGSNGKLWEHAHPDIYAECQNPDNGTAGWFVELFRFMLVMEDGDALWIAKGTPRTWLAQGCEIAVESAPTAYGNCTFTIRSDVENGLIRASVIVDLRRPLPTLKLRLRHPDGAKIRSAEVNGRPAAVAPDGETVVVENPRGELDIIARY
ncbi:MAG: hypothetical protein IKX86_03510 [Clostridia bacterium]|nr:hypothetical protein [Clostridia bacterium]